MSLNNILFEPLALRNITLPKKWSKVGSKGKIRVTVQFLGSLSVQPSNTASVKQYVGTPLK